MKKSLPVIVGCSLLAVIFMACGETKQKAVSEPSRPIVETAGDTVITYEVEGLSAEGGEATARYVKGQLTQCVLLIAGETGQRKMIYNFAGDSVNVEEEQYSFEEGILMSDNDNKLRLDKTLRYTIDTAGHLRGPAPEGAAEIFAGMKNVVPGTAGK